MRVSVVTLGCKVNRYESRAIEETLEDRGHRLVPFGEPADAVVVNSCTVTHRSDREVRALVRRSRRANPSARVVVTGCYAQVEPGAVAALGVDAVVGTADKASIPDLLERGSGGGAVTDVGLLRELQPLPVRRFGERSRAFLKVQDGCEAFCAYCIVPYARGPSRSLPLAEVVSGLRRFRDSGHHEVVLSGVHLGNWGRDLSPPRPFTDLLQAAEDSGIGRIRLSSLEPGEITPGVLSALASFSNFCPHLHVPLQSGSDRILRAMGRPYTRAEFAGRVEQAAASVPGLCLGLDVIAGFPGEDDAAFQETEAFLETLPLAYLHVFPFSPRRGTRAHDLPNRVDPATVKARAARLRGLSETRRLWFYGTQRGRVLPALAEGAVRDGELILRTRNYVPVRVAWSGAVPEGEIEVRLGEVRGATVSGTVV